MFVLAASTPGVLPPGLLSLGQLLASLLVIYIASKLGGELALRLKQPAVLGELVAGLAVGVSGLKLIDPAQPVLLLLAQVGVTLLLFEIGLESELRGLLKLGVQATATALVGMVVPFVLGYGVMKATGAAELVAVFVGASSTATSIGISARVLSELGYLRRTEGQIILGAAVLDDILGVVILSVVASIAAGGSLEWTGVARIVVSSLLFLVGAIVIGNRFMPFFLAIVRRLRTRGELLTASLVFAFALAWLAEQLGSAAIIGAFAAGLVLCETDKRHDLEAQLRPVTDFFLPIFFITVGAGVNLALLADRQALLLALALSALAVVGKLVCGWAAIGVKADKLVIGAGMVPRGEVGLVFASVGLATGVLSGANHTAVVIMVILTTFFGPLLLGALLRRQKRSDLAA
ncbi:cation:proton antiporter [Gloeobacter kilaueensis]|uniref:Sodium/hydrogen exchanger n=1 Tax=Gloeobacter kilaueensis (strain ATCC BAA-2537 / CCAP 1431/1 / ULC 316 / JS1) TaxID=1183438 RepID=U5QFJ2_GLOK1|nr:cation:proton antiporter [Gloeobacter kilaueensis]AGY56359.1 sodium/hydrogen exchanger [Gloeobacter kilaueensis JS1]